MSTEQDFGDHGVFQDALDQLYVVFQPIVSWSRGVVVAFEALMRSRSSDCGRPDQLLAAAERQGRLHDLGRAVRERVAARISELPGHADVYVNLHAADLTDPELVLVRSPLGPYARRIVYEITERAAVQCIDEAMQTLSVLKALGYRVAIDDLGAGFASLSMLALVRPDVVKIDMSLVQGARRDAACRILLHGLGQIIGRLGVPAVAEGVETVEDLTTVLEAGADLVQGYLLARPAADVPSVDIVGIRAETSTVQERMTERIMRMLPRESPAKRRRDLARALSLDAQVSLVSIASLAARIRDGADPDAQPVLHAHAEELLALASKQATVLHALSHLESQPDEGEPPARSPVGIVHQAAARAAQVPPK